VSGHAEVDSVAAAGSEVFPTASYARTSTSWSLPQARPVSASEVAIVVPASPPSTLTA
jgi:hypothetical protein